MSFLADSLYSWQIANSATAQPILLVNRMAFQCEGAPSDPPIIFRLPSTCLKGWNIKIIGLNRKFKVTQNANQACYQGPVFSTTGSTGFVQSTSNVDALEVQCVVANNLFFVHSTQGSISFN